MLGADAVATFDAGGSATIDDTLLIGSLAFPATAADWTISGSGALRFADTGGLGTISAGKGNQRIELPVVLPAKMTVHVESGASLTLAQAVTGGGIVKTGGGRLVLSPERVLPLARRYGGVGGGHGRVRRAAQSGGGDGHVPACPDDGGGCDGAACVRLERCAHQARRREA